MTDIEPGIYFNQSVLNAPLYIVKGARGFTLNLFKNVKEQRQMACFLER